MNNCWKAWLHSIIAAFIGGGASSAVVMVIDPAKFNFKDGLGNLATVFFVAGLFKVLAFLAQSPLPQTMSTTVTTTEAVTRGPKVTTTERVTTTEHATETAKEPPLAKQDG